MGASKTEKKCTHCKEIKPVADFSKERATSDIYRSYCKKCGVKRVQESRKGDKNWWLKFHLKRYFNMSMEEYEAMMESQGYRCAICGCLFDRDIQARKANLDHDHSTGKVRQLLCFNCNTMLGKVNDDIEILESAIRYLRRHNDE